MPAVRDGVDDEALLGGWECPERSWSEGDAGEKDDPLGARYSTDMEAVARQTRNAGGAAQVKCSGTLHFGRTTDWHCPS